MVLLCPQLAPATTDPCRTPKLGAGPDSLNVMAQFAFCMQTRVPLINMHRIKQMRQNQEVFATDHNQFQDRLSGIDGLSPE